eukprot:s2810_g8.t1
MGLSREPQVMLLLAWPHCATSFDADSLLILILPLSQWRPPIDRALHQMLGLSLVSQCGVDLWELLFVQHSHGRNLSDLQPFDLCDNLRWDLITCLDLMLEALDLLPLVFLLLHAAGTLVLLIHFRHYPALQLSSSAPASSPCPSQRGSNPPSRPPTPGSAFPTQEEARVYGFDANQYWQADAGHHDCHKVTGLSLPRTSRSSAFTQRLDIEGCDPLALPVAALLYQQADNFWLRKLAHGRELYLIPTGDIAAVVFGTELLSQLRTRGIDLDIVSQCRARQDGQMLDKINNTKYAAKVVAEHIQQWLPMKATDPSSQHTITQLQQQVAELKQRLGDTPEAVPPDSSNPPPPSSSSPSAPPPSSPIQRALQGNAANPAPEFEPASLLVAPLTQNS